MKNLIIVLFLFINLQASNFGELYFHGNCVTCHFENEKKSAPSIREIRDSYLGAFPKKEDFVDYMVAWVLKPNKEMSIMQHSIDEFELMPELAYDEYTLREIAKFIYENDFNKENKNSNIR